MVLRIPGSGPFHKSDYQIAGWAVWRSPKAAGKNNLVRLRNRKMFVKLPPIFKELKAKAHLHRDDARSKRLGCLSEVRRSDVVRYASVVAPVASCSTRGEV